MERTTYRTYCVTWIRRWLREEGGRKQRGASARFMCLAYELRTRCSHASFEVLRLISCDMIDSTSTDTCPAMAPHASWTRRAWLQISAIALAITSHRLFLICSEGPMRQRMASECKPGISGICRGLNTQRHPSVCPCLPVELPGGNQARRVPNRGQGG
jgi:hypothetical protein